MNYKLLLPKINVNEIYDGEDLELALEIMESSAVLLRSLYKLSSNDEEKDEIKRASRCAINISKSNIVEVSAHTSAESYTGRLTAIVDAMMTNGYEYYVSFNGLCYTQLEHDDKIEERIPIKDIPREVIVELLNAHLRDIFDEREY
nr:MAG TPA: hypothetical protein [Caudoviricetes sp.]